MAWEKQDYTHVYTDSLRLPDCTFGLGNEGVEYTDWFSYGEKGLPYKEVTFIFNYLKVNPTSWMASSLGVHISVEWARSDTGASHVTASETQQSADSLVYNNTPWAIALDVDLGSDPSNELDIAYAVDKFRIKIVTDCNLPYTAGDVVHNAIVLHDF